MGDKSRKSRIKIKRETIRENSQIRKFPRTKELDFPYTLGNFQNITLKILKGLGGENEREWTHIKKKLTAFRRNNGPMPSK